MRIDDVVRLSDLMVTLVRAAGHPVPAGVTGRDLTALARGSNTDRSTEISLAAGIGSQPSLHSIQDRRNKLIVDLRTRRQLLFDLHDDPREQRNLAVERPEVATRLTERLLDELAKVRATAPGKGTKTEIPPEIREQLKALGYLE
jgi:arylsulfatase A-like enzyme